MRSSLYQEPLLSTWPVRPLVPFLTSHSDQPTPHPTSKPVIPSRPASPSSNWQLCAPHCAPPSGSPPCTTYHCQETKWDRHRGSTSTSYGADTAETFLPRGRAVARSSH